MKKNFIVIDGQDGEMLDMKQLFSPSYLNN